MSLACRLSCPQGLEALLSYEVRALIPSAKIYESGIRGTIDVRSGLSVLDISANAVDGFFSEICLNSRITTGGMIRIGEPFEVKWENQMRESLSKLPWKTFFGGTTLLSDIVVKSSRSRLFSSQHIEQLFKESTSDLVDLQFTQSKFVTEGCRLQVNIADNMMSIYLDACGRRMNDMCLEAFKANSRLHMDTSIAAAIFARSLSRLLDDCNSPMCIWDPFCGSGALALNISKVVAGIPAGSPTSSYPFRFFRTHNSSDFFRVADELRLKPHKNIHHVKRILATDSSVEAVQIATRNLEIFKSQLPHLNDGRDVLPFNVDVERLFDAYTPPGERILIVTALPVQGDIERKYSKFQDMIDQLLKKNTLSGCVVMTSKPNEFRRLARHNWLTELRFFDGKRFVEALRLVRDTS
jgi:23S rRNA G2445 N2-methylase RlmL